LKNRTDYGSAVLKEDSSQGLQVILVYALGLAVTLLVVWFRDPHTLF
jgi:hypothetical protein